MVVVCTGSNAEPSRPQFEGQAEHSIAQNAVWTDQAPSRHAVLWQAEFSGEVVHTSDVSGFERFAGRPTPVRHSCLC